MTGLFASTYYSKFTCKNCLIKSCECSKQFDNLQCYGTHKINNVCTKSNYAFTVVNIGKNITAKIRFRATLVVHISAGYAPNPKLKVTSAMSLNSSLQTKASMSQTYRVRRQ